MILRYNIQWSKIKLILMLNIIDIIIMYIKWWNESDIFN